MTVTVLPYARSPYVSILLYTPTYSRHLTIARGVQGIIDFTLPAGVSFSDVGTTESVDKGVTDDERDPGSIKRMLERNSLRINEVMAEGNHTCDTDYSGI